MCKSNKHCLVQVSRGRYRNSVTKAVYKEELKQVSLKSSPSILMFPQNICKEQMRKRPLETLACILFLLPVHFFR